MTRSTLPNVRVGVLALLPALLLALLLLGPISPAGARSHAVTLRFAGNTGSEVVWSALIANFEKQNPDIHVEVTFSNNEEMIAKLRATRGAGRRASPIPRRAKTRIAQASSCSLRSARVRRDARGRGFFARKSEDAFIPDEIPQL